MPYETDLVKPFLSIPSIIQGGQQGDPSKVATGSMQLFGYAGYAKFKYFSNNAYKDVSVAILFWGIAYISVLRTMLGSVSNGGEAFNDAATLWNYADLRLSGATADSRDWSGSAADAYNAQNTEQMARVTAIQGADNAVAAVLAKELEQLKLVALICDYQVSILIAMVPICYALGKSNPVASKWLQLSVTLPAVSAASIALMDMGQNSFQNANKLRKTKSDYKGVASGAAGALNNGTTPQTKATSATQTTVGEFGKLSNVAPESVQSVEPDTAAPASVSLGPDKQFTPVSASTASAGDGESFENASPAEPSENQAPGTGVTPGTTPIAGQPMSRTSQASTQAAKYSPEAGTQARLANQTPGTAQQTGSKSSSGSAAPAGTVSEQAPADKEAAGNKGVPTEGVDGATAGAENGARAPIDVPADSTEQAQEPSLAERMMM